KLKPQDQANLIEAHPGDEQLKSGPSFGSRARAPEIAIDDHDRVARPAERDRAFGQSVLQPRRFCVVDRLLRRRLADVHYCVALEMTRIDLATSQIEGHWPLLVDAPHRVPPRLWREARD